MFKTFFKSIFILKQKHKFNMLEFLCINLHNQYNNIINQYYFIFCIVIHNGVGHIVV